MPHSSAASASARSTSRHTSCRSRRAAKAGGAPLLPPRGEGGAGGRVRVRGVSAPPTARQRGARPSRLFSAGAVTSGEEISSSKDPQVWHVVLRQGGRRRGRRG